MNKEKKYANNSTLDISSSKTYKDNNAFVESSSKSKSKMTDSSDLKINRSSRYQSTSCDLLYC